MIKKRIYFVGASGVGKTTMATYLSTHYGIPRLPSASRLILKDDFGLDSYADLQKDQSLVDKFQQALVRKQMAMEASHDGSFVSDRAFDYIAYTSEYARGSWKIRRQEAFAAYLENIRFSDDKVFVFFVRPTQKALASALAEGQRGEFLQWDAMQRIDGAIQYILESEEIHYLPVDTDRLLSKYKIIDEVMRWLK